MKLNLAIGFTIILGLAIAHAQDATTPPSGTLPPASTQTGVTFTNDIKPIFTATCMPCHSSAGPKKPKGGLALDSLAGTLKGGRDGKVVTVGNSAHSDLVLSVAHIGDDPDQFMPKAPKGKKAKQLTPDQIGLIRAWIDQGAK